MSPMIPLANAAAIARAAALLGRLVSGYLFQDTPNFFVGRDGDIGDEVVPPQERVVAIGRGNTLVNDCSDGRPHRDQERDDDMAWVKADLFQDGIVPLAYRAPCRLQTAALRVVQWRAREANGHNIPQAMLHSAEPC